MKKLICEVDEDYLNELCEAFKKKPMDGIPTHRAWALLEGLKNGTLLDGLTNGELFLRLNETAQVYGIDEEKNIIKVCFDNENIVPISYSWWNRKWGE